MIHSIRIQNFKSLHDVSVKLGPFTVLIGQNGAGKSSFLQALQVLSWLVRHRSINEALDRHGLTYNELVYLRSSSSAMHWVLHLSVANPDESGSPVEVGLELSLAKRKYVYVTKEFVCPSNAPGNAPVDEWPFVIGRKGRLMFAREGRKEIKYDNLTLPHSILLDVSQRSGDFPVLAAVAREVAGFLHYEIWGPEALRRESDGSAPVLGERGGNLPSVLHAIRSQDPGRFAALMSEMRNAYTWLDSIEIRRLAESRYALSFLERAADKRKRRVRYQPSQVSDGFLRLLALTALKHQTGTTSILGYEEPENGMHPAMLAESVRRLRDVAARGTQVIISTHSPFLLQDVLSDSPGTGALDELRLVWRTPDGRTDIQPPNQEVLADAQSQGIGIGELWGMLLDESRMAAPDPRGGR